MTRTATHPMLRRSLALSTALSTALGVTLGVFATPAAAQVVLPPLPTVTPFGTVTLNGISGEAGGQAPVITSTNNVLAPNTLNVALQARSTVLDWVGFNVAQNDTANFVNATAATPTAVVLNRITGGGASTLAGNINAVNGAIDLALANPTRGVEVWIANPNGIIMGRSGNFNTQGFVATTLTFGPGDTANFLNNASVQITAPANATAGITGEAGTITTNGKVLGFIAPVVRLASGTFDTRSPDAGAPAGDVAFVAATDITLGNPASPLSMTITRGTRLGSGNGAALSVGGTVLANNAYLVVSAQNGIDALLNVPASVTTASNVNGVVVLGGANGGAAAGPITVADVNGNAGDVRVATAGLLQADGGGGVSVLGNERVDVGGVARTVGGGPVLVSGGMGPNFATVTGAVDSSGAYTVSSGSVTLGRANAAVLQQAVGNVAVTATAATGVVASAGALTLAADIGETGGSGLAIAGPNGIALGGSTLVSGDPNGIASSAVTLTTTTRANTLTLGNVRAGTLRQGGAAGVASATGLSRTAALSMGDLSLAGVNALTSTTTVTTGALSTGGDLTVRGDTGVTVTGGIGNLGAGVGGVTLMTGSTGKVDFRTANLAGALQVDAGAGGVQFLDLAGTGGRSIVSGGDIAGANILGSGAVALSVGTTGAAITVSQAIGTAATPIGSLAIDGGIVTLPGFTVAGATSLGQTTPLAGLIVTGFADTGSLVADATGAMSWGSLRARTGDVDVASIAGGISFGGAVDGPGALVVQAAPAATVVFAGAVGGTSRFDTFTSKVGTTVSLNGGSLATTATQRHDGRLVLGADTVLTGGDATFAGGVNGTTGGTAHSLALNFTGVQALTGGDFVGIRDLATDTIGAPAGVTALSGVLGVSGSLLFNDAVLLTGATEVRSTGAIGDGNAHAISFASTLDGGGALLVATPGTLTFSRDVGAGAALTSIAAAGANRVEIQGGSVTTTGGQAYGVAALNGPLASGVTLNAGSDGVGFAALNGPRGVTVNAAGVTALAVGATPLAFITTDAAGSSSLTGAIATTGTQTYNDAVTLAGDTVVTGALAVFGAGVTGNGRDLTIATSGAQELGNVVGVNNLVAQLAGGALRLTGSIQTNGDQRYGAAGLIVAADLELRAGAGKVIDIAGPVNGDGPRALTLTAGLTRLRADVGTAAGGQLGSLTVNGGVELLGAPGQRISTVGVQSYGGLVQLRTNATLTGQGASFGGGVDGDGQVFNDLTLTFTGANALPANPFSNIGALRIDGAGVTTLSGDVATRNGQFYGGALLLAGPVTLASTNAGAISLRQVTGAQALTVNTAGATSFDRALSGLASISTDAPGVTLLNAGLSATGGVDLRDNVVLGADLTVGSTGGGALSFGGTVTGPFALTVDTGGLTSFGGAVGATLAGGLPDPAVSPIALTSSGTGAVTINGGAITTNGVQLYAGQVRLGADAVLTGTVGAFGSGIAGNGHDLTLLFANGLTVAGSIAGVNNLTRGGGGTTALAGMVDTIGGQTYLDDVTLSGETVLKSGGGSGTGAITFRGTVDGAQALTVTTGGLTTFTGAVGGTTALASVTIDGAGGVAFNGGGVATTGAQSYAGPATLGVDTRLRTGGGDIALAGPVDGARILSLSAGSGAVTLGGRLGQGAALTGLAIRAKSATVAAGGNRVGTLAVQLDAGPFGFDDAGALTVGTVDGVVGVTTAGATTLTAGGLLTLNAPVSTGALTLAGKGVVSNIGAAMTARGPITIDANDGAIVLGDRLNTTDDGAGAVRLIDAGDVRIGAIATGAGGTVVLGLAGGDNLSGNVTQAAGGIITAGRVVGSVGGSAALTNANSIGTLGAFTANGFALRQANGLSVTGPVNAGAGGLTLQADAGALMLGGDLATGGTATLIGGGAISQTGGGIVAASLTGSAVGGATLTSATNAVPVLAGFTNTGGGGIAFSDSVALTVTADLAGGAGLTLSAPGLNFADRTLSATGNVGLDARNATLTGGAAAAGGSLFGTAGTLSLTSATAGKDLTLTASTGGLTVSGARVGADAKFDANGLAALGAVTAGGAGTITIRALDAAITGTQRAGTVSFVNRAPATVAVKLGDGTSTGGFALNAAEVNNVEAGQLSIDGGGGAIEIGTLALDADAGRTRVDVMTTGRIDVVGAVSGSGAGRLIRFGGSTAGNDDKASVIRIVATPTGGGRLLFDAADLELRGGRIGVGQSAGFLDALGLGGGAGASVGTATGAFVGNPNSALYNPAIGGAAYPAATTLVSARSLTVRYTDYALFQNTAAPGFNSGVVLSAGTAGSSSLIIGGPGSTIPNAFALFGTIGAISGSGTALLGPSVIPTTGVDLGATRINGCLVGSGAGCLTAVVVQPLLSVLDESSTDVFLAADDLAVPFDPAVGTNNEALFAELGLIDDGVAATQCTIDPTTPGCGQSEDLVK